MKLIRLVEEKDKCLAVMNMQINFMVITVHQWYQSLYYPNNAHNVKNVELFKHIKLMEAAPTCFDLQRNHHQGATAST